MPHNFRFNACGWFICNFLKMYVHFFRTQLGSKTGAGCIMKNIWFMYTTHNLQLTDWFYFCNMNVYIKQSAPYRLCTFLPELAKSHWHTDLTRCYKRLSSLQPKLRYALQEFLNELSKTS